MPPSPKPALKPVKVFIVDDHTVVREGTRDMLGRHPDIEVVGEHDSGTELAGLLQLRQPDVLLLDINLPGANGLQLMETLKPRFPDLKIILFSAHSELQYIRRAQQLQADGYLSKTASLEELQQAILSVARQPGTPVFSPDVAEKLKDMDRSDQASRLTAREHEILLQVARGLTNQAIAKNLCLSVKTVDTHVANLMKKTGVNKRTQLVSYAFESGLL